MKKILYPIIGIVLSIAALQVADFRLIKIGRNVESYCNRIDDGEGSVYQCSPDKLSIILLVICVVAGFFSFVFLCISVYQNYIKSKATAVRILYDVIAVLLSIALLLALLFITLFRAYTV